MSYLLQAEVESHGLRQKLELLTTRMDTLTKLLFPHISNPNDLSPLLASTTGLSMSHSAVLQESKSGFMTGVICVL